VGGMNSEVQLSLDEAVAEVLGLLTGLDLSYEPEIDRYRAITRALNRALRGNALESEWSYYASTASLGCVTGCDMRSVSLPSSLRPRIINDDAVRLVDSDGVPVVWAYFLPRDALHKYAGHNVLRCSVTRQEIVFSRHFLTEEEGLEIVVPVMREPIIFRLPDSGVEVPDHIRAQPVDFNYPDVIIARAAYYYAQTDPVMQPRAQTLEGGYKDLMYQLIERDTSITDTPYTNEFILPLENGLVHEDTSHRHPHANFI
jgi:hypothetical protein